MKERNRRFQFSRSYTETRRATAVKTFAMILFFIFCGPAHGELLTAEGKAASTDFARVRVMAEKGNRTAMFDLAQAYERGIGVQQDDAQAVLWYGKAAALGYRPAYEQLATIYKEGRGVKKDLKKAAEWRAKYENDFKASTKSPVVVGGGGVSKPDRPTGASSVPKSGAPRDRPGNDASPAPKPDTADLDDVLSETERNPPGAGPTRKPDLLDSVDRVLADMETANIAFNFPEKMNVDDVAEVKLLLSLKETTDSLLKELGDVLAKQGAEVRVSNIMEARLSGTGFQIKAISAEEQAIGKNETSEWSWEVKPTSSGTHRLHLTLTPVFTINGVTTRKTLRTYDKEIAVEVTAGQKVWGFVQDNWQWLWATLLAPIAIWLFNRWRGRESGKSKEVSG